MIPSLPKLLGVVVIIWLVWTLFRIYETRREAIRAQRTKDANESCHDASHESGGRDRSEADYSIDLRECKICGAWVSGENCGWESCPY